MSLAIKFGNTSDTSSISGFIYFDAVTDYSRVLSGKTTNHPIDAGANITDHFVSENRKFSIKGVITGADISGTSISVSIDNQTPLNANVKPNAVTVSDQGSDLLSFLPASISQFLGTTTQTVVVDERSRVDYKAQVWNIIDSLMTALVYDAPSKRLKNQMSVITLYELEGNKLEKKYDNLIMTNFQVEEDADSGDGMFFTMNLESVNFVTLEKVNLPKDVADALKKAAAPTAKKAKANGDGELVGPPKPESPKILKTPAQLKAENSARLSEINKLLGK